MWVARSGLQAAEAKLQAPDKNWPKGNTVADLPKLGERSVSVAGDARGEVPRVAKHGVGA